MRGGNAQPCCTQLDLPQAFLTGNIENLCIGRDGLADLQKKGRFSDTRVTAEQHHRTGNDSAAQYAVEFLHLG